MSDTPPPPPSVPSPSPSTVPEPELPQPSAAATFTAIALMIGSVSLIVLTLVAIVAAGVFAIRSYGSHHKKPTPVALPRVVAPPVPMQPATTPLPPAALTPTATPPAPTAPTANTGTGPFIMAMSPDHGDVGDLVTLHGHGLTPVEDIILFPQHGGAPVETAVKSTDDRSATFAIPAVEKPEGYQPGDGYYIGAFSKTGACLFVDSTFRSLKPTDTAIVSHDGVRAKFSSPLVGGDHLLVFGDTGAAVSFGNNCTVLLRSNCVLKGYGAGCKIFYMPPLRGTNQNADGLIPMTDIRLSPKGTRLMLKILGDPELPLDPNR